MFLMYICVIVILGELVKMYYVDHCLIMLRDITSPMVKKGILPAIFIDILWYIIIGFAIFKHHYFVTGILMILLGIIKLKLTKKYNHLLVLRGISYLDTMASITLIGSVMWRIR